MDRGSFSVPATPVPASRPKVTMRGTYYPKAHTTYDTFLRGYLKTLPGKPHTGLLEVRLLFVMPPFKGSAYPTSHCDVDNLAKLPLDAMTGKKKDVERLFWQDDDLIVCLISMKTFAKDGEDPHTRVRVIPIEGDLRTYLERKFDE